MRSPIITGCEQEYAHSLAVLLASCPGAASRFADFASVDLWYIEDVF